MREVEFQTNAAKTIRRIASNPKKRKKGFIKFIKFIN